MAVFVLGAGATRGASFVDACAAPCLPPLDSDFFTQLQRVQNPKHRPLVDSVIADAVELFGVNFRQTLETTFTTLEHTLRMISTTKETRDFRKADLRQKRDRLLQALAAVMEESLTDAPRPGRSGRIHRGCDYHKRLVAEMLRPGDEIISFNYDCLMDRGLKRYGDGLWNARYGYGFALGSRGSNLTGDAFWQPSMPADRDDTVRLYKLHGSLHFDISGQRVRLKGRPYTKGRGELHFTIIPPESHKAYDQEPFRRLWQLAGSAINRARHLVLIGYSLPPTDLHSTALFRTSVRKECLEGLVIINPDREARQRTRAVLQRGLCASTRVLVFNTLAEFVASDRALWERP